MSAIAQKAADSAPAKSTMPAEKKKTRFYCSNPSLTEKEEKAVLEAFRTGFISGSAGSYITEFETKFSALVGAKHGAACANGTVAIDLALLAAGLKRGDEVIVPSFTYAWRLWRAFFSPQVGPLFSWTWSRRRGP